MSKKTVEPVLDQVNSSRRSFMQRLILGGGAVALLALPASELLAQSSTGDTGSTGGKGKGKGKGKKGAKGATGATGSTGR